MNNITLGTRLNHSNSFTDMLLDGNAFSAMILPSLLCCWGLLWSLLACCLQHRYYGKTQPFGE
jgi:hypothetical protein